MFPILFRQFNVPHMVMQPRRCRWWKSCILASRDKYQKVRTSIWQLCLYHLTKFRRIRYGQKSDPRLNTVLSISQFIQAFGIYKNIMCKAHPQRRPELDAYERDILEMSSRFGGVGFYEYHKTFPLKQQRISNITTSKWIGR